MKICRVLVALLFCGGSAGIAAGVGCSSASSGATCGSGTTLVGGECVATTDATPLDSSTGDASPDGGGDGAATNDADSDSPIPPNRCPSGHGPRMVEVSAGGGVTYCIDATEVTNAQFDQFVRATDGGWPGDAGRPPLCYNRVDGTTCSPAEADPVARPNHPVPCVIWCDAFAYCAWAGKRLCGRIGGGSLPADSQNEVGVAQWFHACSSGGAHKWTFGDVYQKNACNDLSHSLLDASFEYTPVGSMPDCHPPSPPYAPIVDMTGNVSEWEDSCDAGQCAFRGGDTHSNFPTDTCSNAGWATTMGSMFGHDHGFRCCAD